MQAFFTGYQRERLAREAYLSIAGTDDEVPLMRHGDLYPYGTRAYAVASYEQMPTNMLTLRALVGAEGFQTAYRVYGQRWVNKHPTPFDFFNTFNSVLGRDLSWFWRTWWYETWTLDQAIGAVTRTPNGNLSVTIVDRGLAPMPVRLAVTRANGRVERRELPVEPWLRGAREQTFTLDDGGSVTLIEIDPDGAFPDVDRSNNRWTRQ
jgi:hypothetical protein